MVSINLDSKEPGGPHQSAADVGRDYHLIIKGFSCSNRPGAVSLNVSEFLYKLYNGQSLIPLKYGHHTTLEHAGQQIGRTLRLSFAVQDGVSISLDAALRNFCHKFFDTSDHTACQQLSSFGMYGFSPQEEKMKYFWYEGMFTWMRSYRMEKLAGIEANLAAVRSCRTQACWVPAWRGGLLFALSLGLTWGATRMFGASFPQVGSPRIIEMIDNIMLREASQGKGEESSDKADLARSRCQEFMHTMEVLVGILNETPTEDRPAIRLHLKATVHLVGLFETGYQTVTVCTDAVLAFHKARAAHATHAVFSALQTAKVGFSIAMRINGAETVAHPWSAAIPEAFSLVPVIGQMIFSTFKTYKTHQQRNKWATITESVAASMKLAQCCECYLRWTYNSGAPNGEHSPQYYNELRNLMRALGTSEPLPENCTPEDIRIRLIQYASTLIVKREEINANLN